MSETSADSDPQYREKMQRRKAVRDRMKEERSERKGLIIVHTGNGKGKTSAALGMVLRCAGHGMRAGIVQFIKGNADNAERRALERFGDLVTFRVMGEGFTWETQDRDRDRQAAERAWEEARGMLADPDRAMVVLDEINIAFRYGYLDLDCVLEVLDRRPPMQHVVLTGRNAPAALIEKADLVTDMGLVKHPFRSGVAAQPGVEF